MFLYALLAKIFSCPIFLFTLINPNIYFSGAPGFGCRKRENWTVYMRIVQRIRCFPQKRFSPPSFPDVIYLPCPDFYDPIPVSTVWGWNCYQTFPKDPDSFFLGGGTHKWRLRPPPPFSPPNVSNTKNCDGSWILVHMVLVHTFFPAAAPPTILRFPPIFVHSSQPLFFVRGL